MADVDAMIADLMVDLDGDGVPDAPLSSQLVPSLPVDDASGQRIEGRRARNAIVENVINPMIASKPNVMRPAPQTWGEAAQSFGRHLYSLPLQIAEGIANIPTQFREDMNALAQYQPGSGRVPVNAMLNVAGMASPATMGRGMATSIEGKIGAALRRADAPVPPPPPPPQPFAGPRAAPPQVYSRPPYTPHRMQDIPRGSVDPMPAPPMSRAQEMGEFYGEIYNRPSLTPDSVAREFDGIRPSGLAGDTAPVGRDKSGRFVKNEKAYTAFDMDRRLRRSNPSHIRNEMNALVRQPEKSRPSRPTGRNK